MIAGSQAHLAEVPYFLTGAPGFGVLGPLEKFATLVACAPYRQCVLSSGALKGLFSENTVSCPILHRL
jgi:hypothetical protein